VSTGVRDAIVECGVIAVVRLRAPFPRRAASALVAGGVTPIEITLTTPGAIESIAELTTVIPRCIPGAGTVLDAEAAHRAIDAGAKFVVSPVFDAGVVAACNERDVVCMAGAFTPTEMLSAWRSGAAFVKVFPSAQVGPGYVRDVLAPMPFLRIVPSGGVSGANAASWIDAGVAAVSVGTSLVNAESVSEAREQELTAAARAVFDAVDAARRRKSDGA